MNRGKRILTLTFLILSVKSSLAQEYAEFAVMHSIPGVTTNALSVKGNTYITASRLRSKHANGSINLFVCSKEKKINLASFGFRLNTKFASLFHKNIKTLRVNSLADLAKKTNDLMEANPDKMIKHLWFDSHGKYKKGHALFNIGKDTLTLENILDPLYAGCLEQLTAYCDENSQVTIGACYAGASFNRPANKFLAESPMYGDSLLLAMGEIFCISPVYASESWVMVKPFLFGSRWGLSGHPPDKKFKDVIYKPVWEHMGSWKKVDPETGTITPVHTPYLGSNGDLQFNSTDYLSVKKHQDKMNRKVKKLRPGFYKGY
jgi:hypothetical protein